MSEIFRIHNYLTFQIIDNRAAWEKEIVKIGEKYQSFQISNGDNIFPDLIVEIGKFQPDIQDCIVLDGEYYVKPDYLFHKIRGLKLGGAYSFEITGLEGPSSRLRIDSNLTGMPFIAGRIIDFFLLYYLNNQGISVLHASGLDQDGNGLIFSGRGGSGKTTIALKGIENGRFQYLGDNFILLYKGGIYNFISELNIFGYNIQPNIWLAFSRKEKIFYKIRSLIHKLTNGYIKIFTSFNPMRLLSNTLLTQTQLSTLILLQSGSNDLIESTNKENIIPRLISNMKLEFFPFVRHTEMYNYVFQDSAFSQFWENYERNFIQNLPHNVSSFIITLPTKISDDIVENIFYKISQ